MPDNSKGYEALLRKVYNRFPDMVTDESLVAAHWLIADRGEQYYQEFITELQKEPPNNLPDEDAVDWRTRVVDVGGKDTMITWVPTSRPKEDIESLRKYLEYHEGIWNQIILLPSIGDNQVLFDVQQCCKSSQLH